jgi:uncharacterized membrane protein
MKIRKLIFWAPRVLSILFIISIALLSLDVISPELDFRQIFVGLLMHNIPTLVMIIVLIIAWKYEIVGAVFFILAGLLYTLMTSQVKIDWYVALSWNLTIAGPAILIGILFLISWIRK